MALKPITAPAALAVTLAEAKAHLHVDASEDDAWITANITAAVSDAEHRLGRALVNQTWELTLDAFPPAIELPNPPLASVTSVKYIDTAGIEQTLAGSAYTVDTDNEPGMLIPAYGTSWPATRATSNAVRVRYVVGYGIDGTTVPASIKAWILLRVGALYEHRESVLIGQAMQAAPRDFADGLLDRYKVYA